MLTRVQLSPQITAFCGFVCSEDIRMDARQAAGYDIAQQELGTSLCCVDRTDG
ncbi:hypothetical protein Q3C19_08230 [Bacteroides sp. ET489]|uniref:hypothetical protein n=1 Tax=Bacteroides sp. ET489 TaxID=3057126 RepID=UPI0026717D5A|nr:hypothetical protein [Bacteroides sp. ET489]MDO3390461.1 hypothetical protein [Bacteroides sp. ET489]